MITSSRLVCTEPLATGIFETRASTAGVAPVPHNIPPVCITFGHERLGKAMPMAVSLGVENLGCRQRSARRYLLVALFAFFIS